MSNSPQIHLLGIRHHGPGSARSALAELQSIAPDIVLIEGPPDGQEVAELAIHSEMRPPVAMLIYRPETPSAAVYYPFAEYSPEWQAMLFAMERKVPFRFIDLPQSIRFALREQNPEEEDEGPRLSQDPLTAIAKVDNFDDSESWWDTRFETGDASGNTFEAVLELMTALREDAEEEKSLSLMEQRREAWMRREIRAAQKEGFQSIAVIHGAWHGPALATMPTVKADNELLKGLPKVKVAATWVPWTYGRLRFASGYGAGIESPGYYRHLWDHKGSDDSSIRWMTKVARLLRGEDLEGSTASVIESTRLAGTLALLRGRSTPGLTEFNEAATSVFCFGDTAPLSLIQRKLIVGESLGSVPDETPMVALQRDLKLLIKTLRLTQAAEESVLELDLRKPIGLDRSRLLHRLRILGIDWGQQGQTSGKGTFKEVWRLRWQPDFEVRLIEAGIWGSTIASAASARLIRKAADERDLKAISEIAQSLFIADLPDAIKPVVHSLESLAALTSDTLSLMQAIPPLAEIMRYGDVRQTNAEAIGILVTGLATRVCIGLPPACSSLNDDAAADVFEQMVSTHSAIQNLKIEALSISWLETLNRISSDDQIHGNVSGRATRLLFDAGSLDAEAVSRILGLSLSRSVDPIKSAQWIEGFLKGSGLLLLHNETLWQIIDHWASNLNPESFLEQLPLLRRTFSTFPIGERRQMGQLAQQGTSGTRASVAAPENVNLERANRALPQLALFLGLTSKTEREDPS